MNTATLQEIKLISNSLTASLPSRRRELMAQWRMLDGKLVCYWVST
jgi:hypothetical protein